MWGSDEPWTSIVDANGESLPGYSYEDECDILFKLAEVGRVDLLKDIAMSTPLRFLFGDNKK